MAGRTRVRGGERLAHPAGNRYTFAHPSYDEAGSFKIFGNGDVHILDEATGKRVKFYFDQGPEGVPALIYLEGGSAGKRFPIK